MDSLTALEVRRVKHSEDLMRPGDFTFLEKRGPRRTFEQYPIDPPTGRLRRLWWEWFGKKYALREVLELLWPEYDVIILNCPRCNQPCGSTRNHKIVSLDPLTIETPITCPYCTDITFEIKEGKLMTA
jgi:hypothetical protein